MTFSHINRMLSRQRRQLVQDTVFTATVTAAWALSAAAVYTAMR